MKENDIWGKKAKKIQCIQMTLNFPYIKRKANRIYTEIKTFISSNVAKTQVDSTQGPHGYCFLV